MADGAAGQGALLRVTVAVCTGPREVREQVIVLAPGSTVRDALRACGLATAAAASGTPSVPLAVGVWGRKVDDATVLRDQDRVELYRPLLVDPKVARRERFARQGARTTGLFARQRPGAKAGY